MVQLKRGRYGDQLWKWTETRVGLFHAAVPEAGVAFVLKNCKMTRSFRVKEWLVPMWSAEFYGRQQITDKGWKLFSVNDSRYMIIHVLYGYATQEVVCQKSDSLHTLLWGQPSDWRSGGSRLRCTGRKATLTGCGEQLNMDEVLGDTSGSVGQRA